MKSYNKVIGKIGEKIAVLYLFKNNYKILYTNYLTIYGEVDIVARKKNIISFIEVKTRSNSKYGNPSESVNYKKQIKIRNSASTIINRYENKDVSFSFDVVEIYLSKSIEIVHIKNAF